MSEQKFIKIEKTEEGYFDLYEVYTPQGDMLIKNDDGSFREVITYIREFKQQPISEEVLFNRYKIVVETNNRLVDELLGVKEKIAELQEEETDLEVLIEDKRDKISMYEELLPEEKHLDVEEVESDNEEEEDEDE